MYWTVQGEAGEAGAEHGALVQQILHTQAELQDGNKRERVEIVSAFYCWLFGGG